ncbi:MAG: S8 family serine peptidase [Nitrospirae bacterium]|nr:S8 family serine peptidase [Nitrospirota bacterium]
MISIRVAKAVMLTLLFTVFLDAVALAGIIGAEKVQHKEINEALAIGQAQEVLVIFDESTVLQTAAALRKKAKAVHDNAAILETKASMYKSLKQTVMKDVSINDIEILQDYSHLPIMFLKLKTMNSLQALLRHPSVIRVYKNETRELLLSESLPLIEQPIVADAGYDGSGTTVAVLDTGVDYTRAAFGSCSSPGYPAGCRVIAAYEFAPQDYSLDNDGHGTNVAGIVLGVAPDTRIIALDVFRTDGLAYSSDVIAAINWVIANKATYNIVAMNLSLGSGGFTSPCTTDVYVSPISNARNAGILASISSGNDGYINAITSPACVPAAISVGAVYDSNVGSKSWVDGDCTDSVTYADLVTCFSNNANFLTMLAPGAMITAAGTTLGGTSQAAPHVAGAIAVLREAYPSESTDAIINRLTNTGVLVSDPRNGITKPRLDLLAAYNYDVTPPPAPIGLNVTPSSYTNTNSFSINWTNPYDFSGIVGAYYKRGTPPASNADYDGYTTSKPFNVSATAQGGQTIYVWLKDGKDGQGNVSYENSASTTLYHDDIEPYSGINNASAGNAQVTLSWYGFDSGGSGLKSFDTYKVVRSTGTFPSDQCSDGDQVYLGAGTSVTDPELLNGAQYYYRICAYDNAGNVSTGATASAMPSSYTAMQVLTPNGGEIIPSGSTYAITWGAPPNVVKFKLKYSLNNGVKWTAIPGYIYGYSYDWTVPVPVKNQKACKIKIIGYKEGATVSSGADVNNLLYTIETVSITAPNGGEPLTSSVPYTIGWKINGMKQGASIARIDLSYSKDGGVTWIPIKTIEENFSQNAAYEYLWDTIPVVSKPKNKCKVRVILKDSSGAVLGIDASDGLFTIQ